MLSMAPLHHSHDSAQQSEIPDFRFHISNCGECFCERSRGSLQKCREWPLCTILTTAFQQSEIPDFTFQIVVNVFVKRSRRSLQKCREWPLCTILTPAFQQSEIPDFTFQIVVNVFMN